MASAPEPDLDVDVLMARVRAAVSRQWAHVDTGSQPGGGPVPVVPAAHQIRLFLEQAQRVANIGTTVPPFATLGPIRRQLARWAARILIYFLQVITVDQRVFNNFLLNALSLLCNGLEEGQAMIAGRLAEIDGTLLDRDRRLAEVERALTDRDRRLSELEAAAAESARTAAYLKSGLSLQERRVTDLLDAAGERRSAASGGAEGRPPISEREHLFDALHAALEERFRGPREDITNRQRVYLPVIHSSGVGTPERPIADLGCGRGEWLELLAAEGLHAQGVEVNRVLIQQCRTRGLAVVEEDALVFLRSLPDRSLGAVTAFHLVEHLPYERMMGLLDETVRVLQPGGVAIFETPNPDNLLVAACRFYLDPTHLRPLPSPLFQFLAEARGFVRVTVVPLHPLLDAGDRANPDAAEPLGRYFFGPQDYALIGYKA